MRVDHGGRGMVRLRPAGGEHVPREHLVLRVGDRPERHLLPGAPRDAAVGVAEEAAPAALGEARLGPPRSTRGAVRRERPEHRRQLAPDHRARVGPRPVGAEGQRRRRRPARTPASSRASQRRSAGTASWVRNATWSPRDRSISRLRVPPWENSPRGTSITARARASSASLARAVGGARVGHHQLQLGGRPPARARRPARGGAAARRSSTGMATVTIRTRRRRAERRQQRGHARPLRRAGAARTSTHRRSPAGKRGPLEDLGDLREHGPWLVRRKVSAMSELSRAPSPVTALQVVRARARAP